MLTWILIQIKNTCDNILDFLSQFDDELSEVNIFDIEFSRIDTNYKTGKVHFYFTVDGVYYEHTLNIEECSDDPSSILLERIGLIQEKNCVYKEEEL